MAVPDQRDPDVTRELLGRWLGQRLPGAVLTDLRTPDTNGFSAETLLFDVVDGGVTSRLVAKVAPIHYQIFPDPLPFEAQYRLLRILDRETDLPIPAIRWFEPDTDVLGAPFLVMDRVDGDVPSDMPPYHQDGWMTAVAPAVRERMWWSALDVLAEVHRLDAAALDVGFLDRTRYGRAGLDQRLGYYTHYMSWAYTGPQPVAAAALRWLHEHLPAEPDRPSLLWGDSRIGNIIFRDGLPHAVLDWECACLGAPEEDLAWFLYLDRHHSEGVGVARLDGLPDAAATVARYEGLLGRPMRAMDFYEVLSGFKFAVIMARIGQAFIDFGLVEVDSEFPHDNTATQLLATILEQR